MRRLFIVIVLAALSTTAPSVAAGCSETTETSSAGSVTVDTTREDCLWVYSDPQNGFSQVSTSNRDQVRVTESTTQAETNVQRQESESSYSSPTDSASNQNNGYYANAFVPGTGYVYMGASSGRGVYNGVCGEGFGASSNAEIAGIGIGQGVYGWPAGAPCVPAQAHDALP